MAVIFLLNFRKWGYCVFLLIGSNCYGMGGELGLRSTRIKCSLYVATKDSLLTAFAISQYSLLDSTYKVLYQCKGHKGSVEAVAVDQSKSQFATASADSTVKVWATRDPSEEESMEYLDAKNKKRRKTNGSEAHKIKVWRKKKLMLCERC